MRRAGTGMLAITVLAVFGALAKQPIVPVATRVHSAAVGAVADRFTLSSANLDETGLTFVGLTDLTVGSSTTQTMQFTLSSATMHGLVLTTDCRSSFTFRSTVVDPDTAVVGATSLYLTSFSFALAGSPQTFTVAQPPFVGYALPSETLTDVEMTGVRAALASVTLHHFTQQSVAC